MRFERWHWLIVFILVSAGIHVAVGYATRGIGLPRPVTSVRPEIEVTLTPGTESQVKPQIPIPTPLPIPPKPGTETPIDPTPTQNPDQVAPNRGHDRVTIAHAEQQPKTEHVRLPEEKDALAPIRPAREASAAAERLQNEVPTAFGTPTAPLSRAPHIASITRSLPVPNVNVGGGSPAPNRTLTGKGGAPGPEERPDDTLFSGGGAGGQNLPKEPAKPGGGGGNSILSVNNPLAKESVPEEKAGLGHGTGGGGGAGNGGGIGFRLGKGNGTNPNGNNPLASLSTKSGNGIGNGVGNNTGTRAPGGGKGTGSELPGTGGEGEGYGRGKGIDIGNGNTAGEIGLSRGIPFGDITGKLAGAKSTGPPSGTVGRGGVFGQAPTIVGNGGPIHIIYLLDTSGSMKEFGKIFKAKLALKKAIIDLHPNDMFNIINFDVKAHPMALTMVPATKANVNTAIDFVENLRLNPYTNVSDAMEVALADPTVTHIFLLSDGEPTTGIRDFRELRRFIIEKNTRHVQINTLALGVGERFAGITLLRGIALDNEGQYAYINMLNDTVQPAK